MQQKTSVKRKHKITLFNNIRKESQIKICYKQTSTRALNLLTFSSQANHSRDSGQEMKTVCALVFSAECQVQREGLC